MSLTSTRVRIQFKTGDDIRDAGLTTPENIQRMDDIAYGADPLQVLDVYRPVQAKGKLPVIVSIHGGGWVYGDKERYQYYCMSLAQHGFAVVNFSYRLAPEAVFPACLEDTNTVFTWMLAHAEQYGFDTDRVFAVGDSAGAHLLALYCVFCTVPDYAKQFAFQAPKGFVPTAVGLNCGVYTLSDPKMISGDLPELLKDLLGGAKQYTPENLKLLDPTLYLTESFPPAFVMTCTGDFLASHAPVMSRALMEAGVPHEVHYYGTKQKPLGHVFHCNMRMEEGKQCNADECAWFLRQKPRRTLR